MKKLFFLTFVIVAFSIAQFAFAQVPLIDDDKICTGADGVCNFNDLITLIKKAIDFLIKLAIPVAAIGFGIAGFYYITDRGSGTQRKKANEIFYWTFIGFLWILGAWLIVKAILSGLGVKDAGVNLLR